MNIIDFKNEPSLPIENHTKDIKVANFCMPHLINMMVDPIYVETGVFKGRSICNIVQRCPNIKEAYGVDFWRENVDEFERQVTTYTQHMVDKGYNTAIKKVLSTGHKDKIKFIKEDVSVAVNYFEDNSIDFLFLDHYLSEKDVEECLPMWYNKVKIGGYFAGHDWAYRGVRNGVRKFREQYDIQVPMSIVGAEWVWTKDRNI